MSVHTDQIASVLRRAVQEILARGLNDPRIRGLVSVTGLTVSDDLRQATVNVSVLPAEHAVLALHGLRAAERHIRGEVGRRVRMRRIPELHFRLDESLKRQAEVELAIREGLEADRHLHAGREGEETGPGPGSEPEEREP